jgi:hypothetical protein
MSEVRGLNLFIFRYGLRIGESPSGVFEVLLRTVG